MAKRYRVTTRVRIINWLTQMLTRLGVGPRRYQMLTVKGRKSGKLYSTPVSLVEEGERRWLVAPYGEVNWVLNARAAGKVTVTRRGQSETLRITEVDPEEAAPVLRQYVKQEPITQPYFDSRPDSPLSDFEAEASRHPVFRLSR